uniref:Uncharacterized protein n=1 Tax=Ditylenchus dipsaci TaxID=166011 RepID=A0A915CMY5_9BILA
MINSFSSKEQKFRRHISMTKRDLLRIRRLGNVTSNLLTPTKHITRPVEQGATWPIRHRCSSVTTTKKLDVISCEANPDRCKTMTNELIDGQTFKNLYNFVSLLADYFPTITFAAKDPMKGRKERSKDQLLRC